MRTSKYKISSETEHAETLGVSPAKLSMIMSGKQKPDIPFIKAPHAKLNLPADFILKNI
jgi:HTH-type transcriptional regulator/antitoxin HigA